MLSHYRDALVQIIDFLEHLEQTKQIKYHLVGGILVNLYSDFRTTRDIDLALDFSSANIKSNEFIDLLEKNNFYPYQDWQTTKILADEIKIIQFLDSTQTVRFDNHLITKSFQNKYKKIGVISIEHRVREKIFDIECWVSSKEDFILSKLVYGGWQDYADALGCWIRFKDDLDLSYLKENSEKLNIYKELNLLISGIEDPDEYFEKLNGYIE